MVLPKVIIFFGKWMNPHTNIIHKVMPFKTTFHDGRVCLKPDGTRWLTGGVVKGKLANGVGSQYSHTTSERGVSSITNADAHTSAASSLLNWRPHRFKWTRPFRRNANSGFCACAITFQTHYSWWCGFETNVRSVRNAPYRFQTLCWLSATPRVAVRVVVP
jgi:hypothetical protein